jgi:hypothetical protein
VQINTDGVIKMTPNRIVVEIGEWKILQCDAPWDRSGRWWYRNGKVFRHDTGKRMTEEDLRAMLLSEIERAEHDNRDA